MLNRLKGNVTERVQDRGITVVMWLSLLTLLGVVIIGPKVLSTDSTAHSIKRNSELQSCRAIFGAERTEADASLRASESNRDNLTNQALEAVGLNDKTLFLSVVNKLSSARSDVSKAAAHLLVVSAEYSKRVDLSRDDPQAFIDLCTSKEGAAP